MEVSTYCLLALLGLTTIAALAQLLELIKNNHQGYKKNIEEFIQHWFAGLKRLDENEFFLQYLSSDVEITDALGYRLGHGGFIRWYDELKQHVPVLTELKLRNIHIHEHLPNRFEVSLEASYRGKRLDGSELILLAYEEWELSWDEHRHQPITHHYRSFATSQDL